jgi:hypothetical protein
MSNSVNEELAEVRDEVGRIKTKNKPHVMKFSGLNLNSFYQEQVLGSALMWQGRRSAW